MVPLAPELILQAFDHVPAKSLAMASATSSLWRHLLTEGLGAPRVARRGRLDPQRLGLSLLRRLWLAEEALLYEEFAPGWEGRWRLEEDGQLRPVSRLDADLFSPHGRLWLRGTSGRLVHLLEQKPSSLRFRIAVTAEGDCALGHVALQDAEGRACVWVYVERRSDFVGIPLCCVHINLMDFQLPHLPSGPSNFLSLSFDLDWMHQRLLNIRVDGLLVAEEEDFHHPRCSGCAQLRLFNMRGRGCATAWRELLLKKRHGQCPAEWRQIDGKTVESPRKVDK
ncbi:unnamed protein product [Durusdinium trenchii]|uniref:F-box domain-containing protein n=1 Tax=Durusdinium trenchii TaxID=1381693 RepID=A0ABP0QH65_9DINO